MGDTILDTLKDGTQVTTVTGTVATGALTDAQLRATPVPVSGTVTASGPLTDAQLRATPVPFIGSVAANTAIAQSVNTLVVRSTPTPIEIAAGKLTGYAVENKFGSYNSVTTTLTDIWAPGGVRADHTTAQTLEVLSGSVNDTAAGSGAQQIIIYGLDGNFLEVQETVTMNGTSVVAVTQTFIRVYRLRVTRTGTYRGSNAGTITARIAGAGATQGTIAFDSTFGGLGSSQMSHYCVPAGKTAYLTYLEIDVEASKPVNIFLVLNTAADDVTTPFAAQRYTPLRILNTTGSLEKIFTYPIKIEEKTDIKVQAYSVGATTGVADVFYQLVLVTN